MVRLEIFDGTKTYMYPNGALATPDTFRRDFTAIDYFPHVLTICGNICQAIEELSAMRARLGIDTSLSDVEALTAMETLVNTTTTASTDPTPEERIASALEFQNVLAMPSA